jgi:hypothetical protein
MLPSRLAIKRRVVLSVSAERVAYFVKSLRTSVCPGQKKNVPLPTFAATAACSAGLLTMYALFGPMQ